MLLKKYNSNTFRITLHELCMLMNDKPTKNIYNALMKSLDRMCEAHITIEKRVPRSNNVQTEISGPIVTSITKSEESGKMILELNPYLLFFFRDRFITRMDIRLRSDLHGEISKALYWFYEGQSSGCYALSILKLSQAININYDGTSCLRGKIRKAMHELEVGRARQRCSISILDDQFHGDSSYHWGAYIDIRSS